MEAEEISSKNNPLLKRKEIVLKVIAESATPKKNEVLDKLCAHFNVTNKKLVVIDTIKTGFGMKDCRVFAKIYESEDAFKSAEPQPKKKEGAKGAPNVPDASGQIKVDLGPSEEKKEEKPAEEKPAEKKEE
ncbi:MAG: hypothetical protein ABIF92_02680 [archaeon]